MNVNAPKTGLLFLNMGGPDCLDSVQPFLYNLFSDPDIIRLPLSRIFQKPLAWYISTSREKEARHNYAQMGGASPILKFSQAQAEAVKAELVSRGYPVETYLAMRYWHPFTHEAVSQMMREGIERVVVLPLYPHFSYTTTGSNLNELRRVMTERNFNPSLSIVTGYAEHPIYLKALAETIQQGIETHEWSYPPEEIRMLFSAHSLPLKHIKRTNDPYPQQIEATAETVMKNYFPNNPWELCYQSQVGNMPWLGPSVEGVLHYFSGKRMDNILMVPISFVSDHVETLVEIDKLYLPMAKELEINHCHRTPALNTRPTFIQALTSLAIAELDKREPGMPVIPPLPELLQTGVPA